MKRMIALLLCFLQLCAIFAGCGGTEVQTSTTESTIQTEATQEPTTEPTVDPEELFLQSLPGDVRRAYEAGLVERDALEDLERSITVGEAAALLQKAQTHRAGSESRVLADLQTHETFAARNADRAWLMGIPALVDLENAYPDRYTDYEQWTQEVRKIQYASLELHFAFASRLGMRVSMTGDKTLWNKQSAWDMTYSEDGNEYLLSAYDVIITNDSDYADFGKTADSLYVTDARMLSYGLVLHDGTTGKKFMEMDAGQFNPFQELTFGEVVESALRLYNAPNPVEYPEFVMAQEVGKYNEAIITPELLSKETDLPEASCEKLPASWHGVVFNDLQTTDMDPMHLDAQVYEYEIQAVKDAGFNYIGLYLDFSWLQDYTLFESARVAFHGMIDAQDKGKVSVQQLEQLDQILAWCMERDIHVDLRACALPNINLDTNMGMYWQLDFNGQAHAQYLADMWQAIARRYADIPNEYLSFTLFSMDCAAAADTLLPSVDAIRAESPDRCIIAEMNSYKFKAETFAEKGVALSSRIYDYEGVSAVFNHTNCVKWEGPSSRWDTQCLDVMQSFSWPHADTVDALTLFSYRHWNKVPSTMDVISVAEQYGVGCMLSDFGVRLWENDNMESCTFPRLRYPMDSYTAMIRDFAATAENLGLGWCYAYWYGPYGVAFGMPLFDDTTYTQVEDYPYYIDQTVLGCFRELNGVGQAAQAAPTAVASVEAKGLAATASSENPYYEVAAKAGISVENVSTEPINGREMAKLLDQFMAHIAPEKLDTWKKQYFSFRASLEPLSRMDMIASIYLAVQAAQNPDYLSSTADAYVLSQQVKMDWDAEYLNWLMFGGFENLPDYEVEIFGKKPLDAAAHYYNLARTNPVTGESLLDLDTATNTMRYGDEATYHDAIVALGRLMPVNTGAQTITLKSVTAEEAQAMVAKLNVPADQQGYYLAAAQAGISLDNISTDPITGREMAQLLDQFVASVAPDKLAAWQKQCSGLRVSHKTINRMDAIAAIFMAVQSTENDIYIDTMADAHALNSQVTNTWDVQLTYGLFDDWDNELTYDVDIFSDATLDAAAHYYNLGRTNVLTGESLLNLDAATNTMRYGDEATWQDVIVALGRLLYRDNEALLNGLFPDSTWLYEGEDDEKIVEYRTLAAERKDAIVNSKTTIVKGETFIPGETYTGTAYYVSAKGDDSNDGLTPETAWKTTNAVNEAHFSNKLKSGDAVFFERGSTYRVDPYHALVVHDGVTYSAYGEGDKPVLTFTEGNKADPTFWELYYDRDGMKIWKYHQDITDVGGIVFNDSSYASRVLEWPTNGKWQALKEIAVEPFNGTMEDPFYCTPGRLEGTGEFRKVEENLPENLNYICRVDIANSAYPMNFVENPRTGMPYTGELYLRCDEGNPGDVFEELVIIGYSDVTKGSSFKVIDATDISNFILDNLAIKYYLDTAVHATLRSENIIVQNCEVGWGGNRIHTVASAQPTGEYFNIGDGLYNIVNDSIIRNNYVYHSSSGCGFENGPMGYEKDMGVFTCSGNLFENNAEGVRCFLFLLEDGDVPIEKMVIQDNMILDTGDSMNTASGEMNTVIDIFETQNFAKEILVADNICIGSGDTMLRMGNPMNVNEIYRNNVWAYDPDRPFAYLMNSWSNYCIYRDNAQ